MKQFPVLVVAALWLTPMTALRGGGPTAAPGKPNIVIVLTDDLKRNSFCAVPVGTTSSKGKIP